MGCLKGRRVPRVRAVGSGVWCLVVIFSSVWLVCLSVSSGHIPTKALWPWGWYPSHEVRDYLYKFLRLLVELNELMC